MNKLHLAGVVRESIVDGPGIRYTVFAQGCPHRCQSCHNPQTWCFEGGVETDTGRIISEMKKNPMLKGLTLSGGEPFCQGMPMAELAREAHSSGYDVITYTGFTFEELLNKAKTEEGVLALLEETDILVDGPFIQDQKSYDLRFRGSANQRIIDVKSSLNGSIVTAAF